MTKQRSRRRVIDTARLATVTGGDNVSGPSLGPSLPAPTTTVKKT